MQETAENIELPSGCDMLQVSGESRARRHEVTLSPIDSDVLYTLPAIAAHCGMSAGQAKPLVDAGLIPTFKLPGRQARCASKSSIKDAWRQYELEWQRKRQRAALASESAQGDQQ
jgi:hypothetical protein